MQTFLNIMEKFDVKPQDMFDYNYFEDEEILLNKMIDIIKNQNYDKKQLLYKIIKQFA